MKQVQVTTFSPNQRLCIDVEEKLSGNIWRGDFQSKYIEDITQKTGCYKKFGVFINMLISALKCETESVYIDLLTYADLEMLKSKKTTQNTSQSQQNNSKRYVILTYMGEFERVHYPLPLNFLEEPDADSLRRTITRMKNQILMQKSDAFSVKSVPVGVSQDFRVDDFAQIEHENLQLKMRIQEIQSTFSKSHQEFFQVT